MRWFVAAVAVGLAVGAAWLLFGERSQAPEVLLTRSPEGEHGYQPWMAFKTGTYEPDFHALATALTIVLPWDREVLFQGELVPNPLYRETIGG